MLTHPLPSEADGPFTAAHAANAIARLPAVPTPDWCDRARRILDGIAPGARTGVVVARIVDGNARLECASDAPDERARTLRVLALGRARAPSSDLEWCAMAESRVLTARAPVDAQARVLVLAFALPEGSRGDEARRVFRGVTPGLVERLRAALDLPSGERSPWLTPRECEVLDLLLRGCREHEIASRLGRSTHTVHDQVKSLYRRLGARTRGQLVARALGYSPPDGVGAVPDSILRAISDASSDSSLSSLAMGTR